MAIAGLLVPEEKSRCGQVPAIEMKVDWGGGGGGYGLSEKKNVHGLTNYFPCLSIKWPGPMGLWIVFDGFFVLQEDIKCSRQTF